MQVAPLLGINKQIISLLDSYHTTDDVGIFFYFVDSRWTVKNLCKPSRIDVLGKM